MPLSEATAAPAPLLEMRNISKTFPGVKALSNVQLTIFPGEVHALMGENGAGKSTLMKILSGAYIADDGAEYQIASRPVVIDGPLAARAHGVAVIYQELSLAPNLSVAENIYLGRHLHRHGMVDRAAMARACEGTLAQLAPTSRRRRWSTACRSPSASWSKLPAPCISRPASW